MVCYYTCREKRLPGIYIGAYGVDIGASYGQIFVRVDYIYIEAYDIGIRYLQGHVFVRVNNINMGAYNIDIGALWIVFGPFTCYGDKEPHRFNYFTERVG